MWFFQDKLQYLQQEQTMDGSDVVMSDEVASVVSFSSTASNAKNIDSILAEELYSMPVHERESSQEELHGAVSLAADESPQVVAAALQQIRADLDLQMQSMDRRDGSKQAFWEAYWLPTSQQYIKSDQVCLKYLRADRLDASKACHRMLAHLRLMHKYFGQSSLQRPLRYSDLSRKEQDVIKAGVLQILPTRDRTGRLVSISQGSLPTNEFEVQERIPEIRVLLYWLHVISEDIETQKRGLVWILMPVRRSVEKYKSVLDPHLLQDCLDLFGYKPFRVSAVHFIHPPGALLQLLKAFYLLSFYSKEERAKAKFHTGSAIETQYELLSYGIPIQELPFTASGTIKTKNHLLWIKGRKLIDKVSENGGILQPGCGTFHPSLRDVLFSRGGNASHYGNAELRQMMLTRMEGYNSGGRKERLAYRREIIDLVHKNQGRFLVLGNEGLWVEIDNEKVLMEKLTNAFYDINRKRFAKNRQQTCRSDTVDFLNPSKRQRMNPFDNNKLQGCLL